MPWGAIAAVAAPIIGGLFSSNSASNAADTQAASTAQAVAETKREYDQSRSDLAPYREAGASALSRLRTLLGIGASTTSTTTVPGTAGTAPALTQDQIDEQLRQMNDGAVRGEDGMWRRFISSDEGEGGAHSGSWANLPGFVGKTAADLAPQQGPQTITTTTGPDTSDPEYGSLLKKFSPADLAGDTVYNSGLQFGLDEGTKAIERRAAAGGSYDSGAALKALTRFGNDYGSTKAADAYGRFVTDQNNTYGRLSGIAGMGQGATNTGVVAGSNAASSLSDLYTGQGNAAAAAGLAGNRALTNGINSGVNNLPQLSGGGQRATGLALSSLYGSENVYGAGGGGIAPDPSTIITDW